MQLTFLCLKNKYYCKVNSQLETVQGKDYHFGTNEISALISSIDKSRKYSKHNSPLLSRKQRNTFLMQEALVGARPPHRMTFSTSLDSAQRTFQHTKRHRFKPNTITRQNCAITNVYVYDLHVPNWERRIWGKQKPFGNWPQWCSARGRFGPDRREPVRVTPIGPGHRAVGVCGSKYLFYNLWYIKIYYLY